MWATTPHFVAGGGFGAAQNESGRRSQCMSELLQETVDQHYHDTSEHHGAFGHAPPSCSRQQLSNASGCTSPSYSELPPSAGGLYWPLSAEPSPAFRGSQTNHSYSGPTRIVGPDCSAGPTHFPAFGRGTPRTPRPPLEERGGRRTGLKWAPCSAPPDPGAHHVDEPTFWEKSGPRRVEHLLSPAEQHPPFESRDGLRGAARAHPRWPECDEWENQRLPLGRDWPNHSQTPGHRRSARKRLASAPGAINGDENVWPHHMTSSAPSKKIKMKPHRLCEFCKIDSHGSIHCSKYPTLESRVQFYMERGICTKCGRENCSGKVECDENRRVCGYCGRIGQEAYHPHAICKNRYQAGLKMGSSASPVDQRSQSLSPGGFEH